MMYLLSSKLRAARAVLILFVTLLVGGASIVHGQEDNAVLVQRTLMVDDSSNNNFEQKGLMLGVSFESNSDWTIGFWMRRVVQSDTESPDYADQDAVIVGNGGTNSPMFSESDLLPDSDDYGWHYVVIRYVDSRDISAYVDGVWVASYDNYLSSTQHMVLGSRGLNIFAGSLYKSSTMENFLFDDISIFSSNSDEVFELHEDIYNLGVGNVDFQSHESFAQYYLCDDLATSPSAFTEDGTSYTFPDASHADALGAAVNFSLTEDNFVNSSDKPLQQVLVSVETAYGADDVLPQIDSSGRLAYGSEQRFEAPEFVYLDRYSNELGTSNDDTTAFIADAFYRAKNVGYAVDGTDNQGTERFFTIESLEETIEVVWQWELEYAVIVEMAVGSTDGLSDSLGNPFVSNAPAESQNSLGKKWVPANTLVSTAIDGIIFAENNLGIGGGPSRFTSTGFIIENAPVASDSTAAENQYVQFDDAGGWLDGGDLGLTLADRDLTIEFWARLDPNLATADQNIVSFGGNSGGAAQIRTGFRKNSAPAFFAMANNNGSLVDLDTAYTDNDWHHWAVVYDDVNGTYTVYRDGEAVSSGSADLDFSGDSYLVIGGNTTNSGSSGSGFFPGGVDNVRVWGSARSASEVLESMTTQEYGSSESDLMLELTFDSPSLTSVTSTEGSAFTFTYQDADELFPSEATDDAKLAALYPEFDYSAFDQADPRVSTEEYVVKDWLRVSWQWQKEYRIRLSYQSIEAGIPAVNFAAQPFVEGEYVTVDANGDYWAKALSEVTVGAKYRTSDRCYTLDGVAGQLYAFTVITDETLVDGTYDGVATRQFTFSALPGGGELAWNFGRTIFRAFVPIGEELDVSSTSALNANLVPDLCVDGELHVSNGTPAVVFSNQDDFATLLQNGGTAGTLGASVQWDAVGKQLLPLAIGEYQLEWQDANDPNASYLIHVVSHLPTETLTVDWEIEDEDGYRLVEDSDYVYDYTFGSVADDFPGTPRSHYRNIFSSDGDKRPPVELDMSDADWWYFKGMSFSTAEVSVDDNTGEFEAAAAARTVLLYSYRPDSTRVATGDESQEAYAVRVVESFSVEDSLAGEPVPFAASGSYSAEVLTAAAQSLRFNDGASDTSVPFGTDGDGRTLDFWVKLEDSAEDPDVDRPIYQCHLFERSGEDLVLSTVIFGMRAPNHVSYPNGMFLAVFDESEGLSTVLAEVDLTGFTQDFAWHHWAISTQGTTITVYVDGVELSSFSMPDAFTAPVDGGGSVNFFANGLTGASGFGTIDNIRLWDSVLDVAGITHSMESEVPTLNTGVLVHDFTFENAVVDGEMPNNGSESDLLLVPGDGSLVFTIADNLVFAGGAYDFSAEVATRVTDPLDTAGFDSGYVINWLSNYNSKIYNRDASVGLWGSIYPTNWSGLYELEGVDSLDVAWYENPFYDDPDGETILHPNVAWPYVVSRYNEVNFPATGGHEDKRIYIASRLGSEGVDVNGSDQLVFDPATYENVGVYNQPDPTLPGFNPNEEHAFVAGSIKDQLTSDNSFNLGQDAVFALQHSLNIWGENDSDTGSTSNVAGEFTSEPWVLVEYDNLETGLTEMAAYKVEATRTGTGAVFPVLDSETNSSLDVFGVPVVQPTDPSYAFEYATFAGDLHIPPYPLNLVVGSVVVDESWGGNIPDGLSWVRALWHDINGYAWTVAGEGSYFYRYWYPFRSDFWYESDVSALDGDNDIGVGTPIAWLPVDNATFFEDGDSGTNETTEPAQPAVVVWDSYWRDDYPVIKRGESLTYSGGEYFNENSGAEGLPAVVGMAAAQIIYDSANSTMLYSEDTLDLYSARVVRALDDYRVAFAASDLPEVLTPAYTDNIMVDGPRYYFKHLVGSLQKRFYYDSLSSQLIFRGRLNDLESGDPDLTATPISLYLLEPNVMTQAEYTSIIDMLSDLGVSSGSTTFDEAVETLYEESQNPHGLSFDDNAYDVDDSEQKFYSGMEAYSADSAQPEFYAVDAAAGTTVKQTSADLATTLSFWASLFAGETITITESDVTPQFQPISSLGTGSVLVTNPTLLTAQPGDTDYVTLVENNHEDAGGAISLHIIQIGDERYRGAIKAIEAADVFSEKINVKHTGDFGGNVEDVYYQWWVRDAANLATIGLPAEDSDSADYDIGWQLYTEGLGLNVIAFEGRPDIALADKLFYVRYAAGSELEDITSQTNVVSSDADLASSTEDSWRLVDLNDSSDDYTRSGAADLTDSTGGAVPFQWAGASNSPQLQADGSYNFIPQLVMGWVKRVLDRINPYEARYTDFYNNESPATYSSQLQIAGGPYAGNVALNSDKDVIENVGLIELYETVLNRAKSLTLEIQGAATDSTNQAVLLASTRLAFLYELLAREAYTDAQDSTVTVTAENGLSSVAPYVHAFMNQEASLLHEELALLRGTDFVKAYPAYNRMFWNYVKGEGEAAYNANYNVYDETQDGFINEFDAAALYPQGHGDAWGHFLSSNKMHFELLRHSAFDWSTVAELYSLLDNVIEVDYLDEKSFARIAAAKARAGNEIVKATYREAYVEDPDGQWQGYEDTVEPARAWGVSEWAKRTGHAAYFDWVVGNVLVPADGDDESDSELEGLHQIDRVTNANELAEIAGSLYAIQQTLDGANRGHNPLGLDSDALLFDIDPLLYDGVGGERSTHFEQVYAKAVAAAQNALVAHEYASRIETNVRKIADDTEALQIEAFKQDLDYRNRLIEIFGTPYTETIGAGQIYDAGYEGPDTLLYKYIDRTTIDDFVPDTDDRFAVFKNDTLSSWASDYSSLDWDPNYAEINDSVKDIFERYYLTKDFDDVVLGNDVEVDDESTTSRLSIEAPVLETADYAFQAPDEDGDGVSDWGARTSYGRIQVLLNEMLAEQIAMQQSVSDYTQYLEKVEIYKNRLDQELRAHEKKESSRSSSAITLASIRVVEAASAAVAGYMQWSWDTAWQASQVASEYVPDVVGFSTDAASVIEGSTETIGWSIRTSFYAAWTAALVTEKLSGAAAAVVEAQQAHDETIIQEFREMNAVIAELGVLMTEDESHRLAIAQRMKTMENIAMAYQSAVAEGFRLLDEREGFNIALAGKVQRNRYSDMIYRLSRNDALGKYENAFDNALRYAWLAAKAYDYETSLSEEDPYAVTSLLEDLVETRTLGLWDSGEPRIGQGGIAEILAQLKGNFDVLEGQLGINNPQVETGKLSLRHEHFRIRDDRTSSDDRWKETLSDRIVNLWDVPEYVTHCRPFASPEDGEQPGIVIEFDTVIASGQNVFGELLGGEDHAYSSANFATKLRSAGVWLEGYNDAGLSTTPRVYLVPVGNDTLKLADSEYPTNRIWNVLEQRIPAPFVINDADLNADDYLPSIDSIEGAFAEIRRFGDFRAYHDSGVEAVDLSEMSRDNRLIGRSVANSKWLLIIPGASLHSDPDYGLSQLIETIDDVKLVFETYSHSGL